MSMEPKLVNNNGEDKNFQNEEEMNNYIRENMDRSTSEKDTYYESSDNGKVERYEVRR